MSDPEHARPGSSQPTDWPGGTRSSRRQGKSTSWIELFFFRLFLLQVITSADSASLHAKWLNFATDVLAFHRVTSNQIGKWAHGEELVEIWQNQHYTVLVLLFSPHLLLEITTYLLISSRKLAFTSLSCVICLLLLLFCSFVFVTLSSIFFVWLYSSLLLPLLSLLLA